MRDFETYLAISCGLSASSIRQVLIREKIFVDFLQGRIPTKQLVEEFLMGLKERGLKNNSLNAYVFMLRFLYKYQVERKLDPEDFTIKSLPKNKPIIEILSIKEIEAILDTDLEFGDYLGKSSQRMNFVYKTLMHFLACTGCRFSEAQLLKGKYLDLGNNRATFIETKNKEYRHAYFTQPLAEKLKKLVTTPENYVFTNMSGHEIHPTDFGVNLRKYAIKAGITKRVHPHLFRHSLATHLLMNGVDVTQVATILGHKDIQTTFQSYVHLADESIKRAMYLFPLNRKHMPVSELLNIIRKTIEGLKLEDDPRFEYQMTTSQKGLELRVTIT